jgi:magnesium-transporting ATPase (P-type)
MITGDSKETAVSIAHAVGIIKPIYSEKGNNTKK